MDKQRLCLSSVPLQRVDKSLVPIGLASGCVMKYPKENYLLTVFHAAKVRTGRWAVACEWVPGKGTKLVFCGTFNFQKLVNIISGKVTNIDFAFSKFPLDQECFYQEIELPETIAVSIRREKHDYRKIQQPVKNTKYGFCGQVMPEIVDAARFYTHNMIQEDIEYIAY